MGHCTGNDQSIIDLVKDFSFDNKDVQQISLIEDELQFIGEGDPERLLDEFHALGYDLAYKDQPLTPAYLAKSIAEYSTPEEGCTQMFAYMMLSFRTCVLTAIMLSGCPHKDRQNNF